MERTVKLGMWILLGVTLLLTAGIVFSSTRPNPTENNPDHILTPLPEETNGVPLPPTPNSSTDTAAITPEVFHPKSGRYVAAWMPTEWDTDNARASFEANLDYIDEISPVWYDLRSNGTLNALGGSRDSTLIEVAHKAGVLVLPSITNGFDPDRTGYTLRSPERRSRLVQRILDEVEEYNYDGIDIDFEAVPSSQRDVFTAFIRELAAGLHAQDKLLAIAVHARTSDKGGTYGSQAQDWEALGQAVDRFRIMTYDYHWRGGGAGPVSPIYWVEDVIEYAKTRVPPSKIEIGVPFYGYDWVGGDGSGVTWLEIQDLIEEYEPDVNLQEQNEEGEVAESWFTYRARDGRHEVWFASRRSMEAKLDLVIKHDLGGIAIWRLGGEDPGYWQVIHETLKRDPYQVLRSIIRYLPDP